MPALVHGAHDRRMGRLERLDQRRNRGGRDHRRVHGRHEQSSDPGTVCDGEPGKHRSQLAAVRAGILDISRRHRQPMDFCPESVVFDPPHDQHFVEPAIVQRLGKATDEGMAGRTAGKQRLGPPHPHGTAGRRMMPAITLPVYGRSRQVSHSSGPRNKTEPKLKADSRQLIAWSDSPDFSSKVAGGVHATLGRAVLAGHPLRHTPPREDAGGLPPCRGLARAGIMATTAIYSVAPRRRPRPVSLQGRRSPDERAGVERRAAGWPDRLLGRSVPRDRRAEHDLRRRRSPRRSATSCGPATASRSGCAAITARSTPST